MEKIYDANMIYVYCNTTKKRLLVLFLGAYIS